MKTITTLTISVVFGLFMAQAQQPPQVKVAKGYGVPVTQTQPEFAGGPEALGAYIRENLKYPEELRASHAGGKVIIMFIVDKEGKIIDPVVMKGVNDAIDQEALRMVKAMPDWKPGTTGGQPVNKQYILPIEFVPPSI